MITRIQDKEPTYRASTFKPIDSRVNWDTALGKLPKPHALQSWTWGNFKSRWGWQMQPHLLTIAESRWEPLAAAMVLKRPLPRTPFCILYVPKGPILNYNDKALRQTVLQELERIAQQERAIFIKIDPDVVASWGEEAERPSPIGSQFAKQLQQRGWRFSPDQIQFRNTVELALDDDEDDLLMAMKSKTRYNIRYAGRKDVVVRQAGPEEFATIAEMYAETAERDGFTIRPIAYYLDAWTSFHEAGMAQAFIADYHDESLAAVIIVKYGQRAIYMYGASTSNERKRMPTYALQWAAIKWAKEQGCTVYDFWGAPDKFEEDDPLWGVWRFKSGFSGEVVRHIGAWDYPVRPWLYTLYTRAIPRYLNWLRNR